MSPTFDLTYSKSCSAVWCGDKSYGAVRCAFENKKILWCGSVRFSAMKNPTVRFGAVLKRAKILRCGSVRFPVKRVLLRCGAKSP